MVNHGRAGVQRERGQCCGDNEGIGELLAPHATRPDTGPPHHDALERPRLHHANHLPVIGALRRDSVAS